MAAQTAFSFLVLFVGALFLTSFARLVRTDLGFDPANLVVVEVKAGENGGVELWSLWRAMSSRRTPSSASRQTPSTSRSAKGRCPPSTARRRDCRKPPFRCAPKPSRGRSPRRSHARELPRVHPNLRVTGVTRQSTLVRNTLVRDRVLAVVSAFFSIVAIVLVAVGLCGVLGYAVVQRTREIGIRMALGARPAEVMRLVVADTGLMALAGVGLGSSAASRRRAGFASSCMRCSRRTAGA